jgi:hypothetical protein
MIVGQADPGWEPAPTSSRAAAARPEDARRRPTASPTASRTILARAARRGDRLPQAGRLRARRLALLPHRQAFPGLRRRRLENFARVETFGDNQQNGNKRRNWPESKWIHAPRSSATSRRSCGQPYRRPVRRSGSVALEAFRLEHWGSRPARSGTAAYALAAAPSALAASSARWSSPAGQG